MTSKAIEPSVLPSTPSLDEEKKADNLTVSVEDVIDFRDKDEALKLVGYTKTIEFSDEYYRKLRRKIVSHN